MLTIIQFVAHVKINVHPIIDAEIRYTGYKGMSYQLNFTLYPRDMRPEILARLPTTELADKRPLAYLSVDENEGYLWIQKLQVQVETLLGVDKKPTAAAIVGRISEKVIAMIALHRKASRLR